MIYTRHESQQKILHERKRTTHPVTALTYVLVVPQTVDHECVEEFGEAGEGETCLVGEGGEEVAWEGGCDYVKSVGGEGVRETRFVCGRER